MTRLQHATQLALAIAAGLLGLAVRSGRTIPRHNEDACEDCRYARCDRQSVVL